MDIVSPQHVYMLMSDFPPISYTQERNEKQRKLWQNLLLTEKCGLMVKFSPLSALWLPKGTKGFSLE